MEKYAVVVSTAGGEAVAGSYRTFREAAEKARQVGGRVAVQDGLPVVLPGLEHPGWDRLAKAVMGGGACQRR